MKAINLFPAASATLLTLAAVMAWANESADLQQLLAENKNLTLQLEKTKKVEGEIAKAELSIQGAQSALNRAKEQLRTTGTGLVEERRSIERQAQQAGCPWGTSSTNIAFVNACNAEGRRLMAMFEDVRRRGASLEEYARELDRTQNELSNRTVTLFAKKKENRLDQETLAQARADWLQRYNAFIFRSETYNRLRVTAPRANICAQSSLEDAAQCLQWLWDGANRYPGRR